MRILWLVRYPPVPPANGGDAAYSRNLIEHVSRLARVDVLSYSTVDLSPKEGPTLAWHLVPNTGSSKLVSLFSPLPNVAYRHRQAAFLDKARTMALSADAVVVDHVGLFFAVEYLRKVPSLGQKPIIVINHDHEGSLRTDMTRGVRNPLVRGALYWDGLKAGRLETVANRLADGLTAITTTDQKAFAADAPGTPSLLLMPGYAGPIAELRSISDSTPMRLCILGGRGAFHKQMVLRMILDRIMAAGLQHKVIVDVVGGPTRDNAQYPGVNFLGFIDDLKGYMETVRLGLIPDELGGGFKLRALTHTFLRVPMLALNKAMSGMTLRPDVDFIGVESIEEMVNVAPGIMMDHERLNEVQDAAFETCRVRFAWDDRARDLVSFAETLISQRLRERSRA